MAGNGYDNGQGADPRIQGWSAPTAHTQAQGQPEYLDADRPGHTRAFSADEYAAYGGPGDAQGGGAQGGYDEHVAVYRAGGSAGPHLGGPPLPWKALLTGMFREPSATFDQMRDHQVWLPALCVSLLYGVLAVLGLGMTRNEVFNSTFAVALWSIAGAAITFTIAGALLGAATFGLARQLGGDGPWRSTIGLAVLIGWLTDAPRLVLALFLPAGNGFVQAVGWLTWLLCAALLTIMVRRVHDLPWGKAAGAGALQLLALLALIKLPTLG